MKFNHYQERVEASKEFKDFSKQHKKAYLGAGFFILDFEAGKNSHQLDYVLPNGKIATFILDDGIKMKISEQAIKKTLDKIPQKVKTDLEALRGIVHDEMRNRNVTDEIRKIIAVLHILDNKLVWNLQCILNGLSILNVHVDDSDQTVLKFEKYSLMDVMKMMPKQVQPQQTAESPASDKVKEIEAKLNQAIQAAKEKAKKK